MAEFFHMGGYAFYVWGSYLVVAIMFGYHYFSPVLNHRRQVEAFVSDFSSNPNHPSGNKNT